MKLSPMFVRMSGALCLALTIGVTRADVLDLKIPMVRFNQVALIDAVGFLRDVSGGNFYLDANALGAAKISTSAPVTMQFDDAKVSQCLETICAKIDPTDHRAGYAVIGNVIVISTTDALRKLNEAYKDDAKLGDAALQKRLDQAVSMEAGRALHVVVETLSKDSGQPIKIDGLDPDTSVDLGLAKVPARIALQLLANSLSNADRDVEIHLVDAALVLRSVKK